MSVPADTPVILLAVPLEGTATARRTTWEQIVAMARASAGRAGRELWEEWTPEFFRNLYGLGIDEAMGGEDLLADIAQDIASNGGKVILSLGAWLAPDKAPTEREAALAWLRFTHRRVEVLSQAEAAAWLRRGGEHAQVLIPLLSDS